MTAMAVPATGTSDVMTVGEIAAAVAVGELSATEALTVHLERIARLDPALNAVVSLDPDAARRAARRVDARVRHGRPVGPLAGVPVLIKDNLDVRGQVTAAGSAARPSTPALRDATAVARLRRAGAIVLGRANMDELAMGASTSTSAFGRTRNPRDLRRSPGGSSGGSAAAVAAGLVPLALGTDTGGSIREPASQCGVVGLAPTPGLIPLAGVVPFAPALDRVGPIAASVADTRLALSVLAGRPLRASEPVRRVGVVTELVGARNQPGVLDRLAAAERALAGAGIEIVSVRVPDAERALAAYLAITSADSVEVLEAAVRTGRAGAEVERRWRLGRELLGPRRDELDAAQAVQRDLVVQVQAALTQCDVLLSPTMPTTAPLLDVAPTDPMRAPYTDCWTVVASLTGVPAVSVPAGVSSEDGLPVGVQLAGRAGADAQLLAAAARLERSVG